MGSHLNIKHLGREAGAVVEAFHVALGSRRLVPSRTSAGNLPAHGERSPGRPSSSPAVSGNGRASSDKGRQRGPIEGFGIGFRRPGMIPTRLPSLVACGFDVVALDPKVILAEGKLSEAGTCKAGMPGPGTRQGWHFSGVRRGLG